jgi:hypothetical protein
MVSKGKVAKMSAARPEGTNRSAQQDEDAEAAHLHTRERRRHRGTQRSIAHVSPTRS